MTSAPETNVATCGDKSTPRRRKFGPHFFDYLGTFNVWQDARRSRDSHRQWGARIINAGKNKWAVFIRPPPESGCN